RRRHGDQAALEPLALPVLQAHLQHAVHAAARGRDLRRRRMPADPAIRRRRDHGATPPGPVSSGDGSAGALLPRAGAVARGGCAGAARCGHRPYDEGPGRDGTPDVIIYKSADEITKMREAGRIVAGTIERVV